MPGCFLQLYFSGSFRTSWPSRGCTAKIMRAPATSYYPQASPGIALSRGKPYFHAWHFSQWLSAPQFEVSLEFLILQVLSFLEVPLSDIARALLFKCLPLLRGGCFLLPSCIFRCCLLCSRWTGNEYESNAQNNAGQNSVPKVVPRPALTFPCPASSL